MGMLLTDAKAARVRKSEVTRHAYLPEPDPHDLCGLESGSDTSPFFRDEPERLPAPPCLALPAAIPADIVIGG
jgi:hypothetical protein